VTTMTASVPRNADSWTLDDLYDLPEDGNRYELIEGRLLVSPAPALPHLRAASRLHRLMLRSAPEHLIVGQNGGIVHGPRKQTYFIPDLIVIPDASLEGDRPALVPADTLLVAEILSPGSSTTDDVTKRYYYARMGIPHYWIVDPKQRILSVLLLDSRTRQYRDAARVVAGESWHTVEPFPVTLDPAEFC
jgi:Uma2 family endonuclease